MDYSPTCELNVPGAANRKGPGWYLIGGNRFVEAGPFPTITAAMAAVAWMHHTGRGVNPGPWLPVRTHKGLIVGMRYTTSVPWLPGGWSRGQVAA